MDNKSVLVTGATSGIGLALIDSLLAAGYHPILTARNAAKVQTLADEKGVAGYALDVADADAVTHVCAQVEQEHGPLWGLVNNAGILAGGGF